MHPGKSMLILLLMLYSAGLIDFFSFSFYNMQGLFIFNVAYIIIVSLCHINHVTLFPVYFQVRCFISPFCCLVMSALITSTFIMISTSLCLCVYVCVCVYLQRKCIEKINSCNTFIRKKVDYFHCTKNLFSLRLL